MDPYKTPMIRRRPSNTFKEEPRTKRLYTKSPIRPVSLFATEVDGHIADDEKGAQIYTTPDDGYETDDTVDSTKTAETAIDDTYISPRKIYRSKYKEYLKNIQRQQEVPTDYETSDTELDEPDEPDFESKMGGKGKRQTKKRRRMTTSGGKKSKKSKTKKSKKNRRTLRKRRRAT